MLKLVRDVNRTKAAEIRMSFSDKAPVSIPRAKVADYLLSTTHLVGRDKAAFFLGHGFSQDDWPVLAEALRKHAAEHNVVKVEDSPFGKRHVIEGAMETPDGR